MKYNWNWGILLQAEPGGSGTYLHYLLVGLVWTLATALAAWVIALSIGAAVGILRTLRWKWLERACAGYVELFRNIPLIVQMFLWFFVLPEVVPADLGRWLKRDMPFPEFSMAVLCLGFYTASRVGEQVRAGIGSIPRSLVNAALASGMTLRQLYRHVLMPLAYRIIVPPLTSEFLGIFKNSSLALTIGVLELTAQSRQVENYTFQGYEAFTAATTLYLAIATLLLLFTRSVEGYTRIPGMIARERPPV